MIKLSFKYSILELKLRVARIPPSQSLLRLKRGNRSSILEININCGTDQREETLPFPGIEKQLKLYIYFALADTATTLN